MSPHCLATAVGKVHSEIRSKSMLNKYLAPCSVAHQIHIMGYLTVLMGATGVKMVVRCILSVIPMRANFECDLPQLEQQARKQQMADRQAEAQAHWQQLHEEDHEAALAEQIRMCVALCWDP